MKDNLEKNDPNKLQETAVNSIKSKTDSRNSPVASFVKKIGSLSIGTPSPN